MGEKKDVKNFLLKFLLLKCTYTTQVNKFRELRGERRKTEAVPANTEIN